jgi:drug/metabolite transporter (DMT)-like permease
VDHDRPPVRTLTGVAIGFVGLAVLLQPGSRPEGVSVAAACLVLFGTVAWAVGSFAATKLDLPPDQLTVTLAEMVGGFLALAVVGLLAGERLDVGAVEASSWWGLAYLSVFGSIVAFTAYSWLLANAPVSQVATYAYVNPVVAVALGAVFVDEAVTGTTLLGGGITLVAVAVVVTAEGRRRTAPPPPPEAGTEECADSGSGYSPTERQGLERSSAT